MSEIDAATGEVGKDDEQAFVAALIAKIVRECPTRRATSASERRAQEILAEALAARGVDSHLERFRFNDSAHASVALHFGIGVAASLLSMTAPALALPLHAMVAASYALEVSRRTYVLRRLLRHGESQNLLASVRAAGAGTGEPSLRVVLVGHIDAAPTGLLFHPKTLEYFARPSHPWVHAVLGRPLRLAVLGQLGLVGLDALGVALGRSGRRLLWPAIAACTAPALLTTMGCLDAQLRDEIVPGANDNLTGCVALPVLASRLRADLPEGVELVLVATGAEEAGLGGSSALARRVRSLWNPRNTVVLAIDSLTNGELRWFEEGELRRRRTPPWLDALLRETASADPRFGGAKAFDVGVGGTDAQPFAIAGYDAVGIGCIDPKLGAPRHYHQPTDTPENLDLDQLMQSIDFIERLVRNVIAARG
jgi:hypothetical protein